MYDADALIRVAVLGRTWITFIGSDRVVFVFHGAGSFDNISNNDK